MTALQRHFLQDQNVSEMSENHQFDQLFEYTKIHAIANALFQTAAPDYQLPV